jgi:hypothetical protein
VLEVGVERALESVGFSREKFLREADAINKEGVPNSIVKKT